MHGLSLLTSRWARIVGSPNESPKNPIIPISPQRWPLITIDYWLQAVPLPVFRDGRRVEPRL
jgi:hypothetical protein